MKTLNRRDFLRTSGAAALFAATPGLAYSQVIGGGGAFDDYRALVCVFMFGGNDSYNMLVPRSNAEYNVYATSRQNLAIPQGDLLAITPPGQGAMEYGLHPSMGGVQNLFESSNAALVTNVGPLVEPTSKTDYFNSSVALPPQLFSHNDQQDQWTSLRGTLPSKTGWAGRMADLIRTGVSEQQMATNASLFGANLMQSADETVAYVMGPTGPVQFEGFSLDPDSILFFNSAEPSAGLSTRSMTAFTNAVSPTCNDVRSMRQIPSRRLSTRHHLSMQYFRNHSLARSYRRLQD